MSRKKKNTKNVEPNRTPVDKDQNNMDRLSEMINVSRAFRTLPPEITMGVEYDGGRKTE